jgi:hypothetical protein
MSGSRERTIGRCEAINVTIREVRKMLGKRGRRPGLPPRTYLSVLLAELKAMRPTQRRKANG